MGVARVSPPPELLVPAARHPAVRRVCLSVRLSDPQVGSGLGAESPWGRNIPWGWPRST